MTIPLFHVDAFTDRPFAGNPAAVCLLPSWKEDRWLQALAREMNLSETAFLVKQPDDFDLRWFTPKVEVDLCGHATLASAHVLWQQGKATGDEIRFSTRSGTLTALNKQGEIELNFPLEPDEPAPPPANLVAALNISPTYVGKNRFDYVVEVGSEDTLRRLEPDFRLLATVPCRGVVVTSRSADPQFDFVSRAFFPRLGVDEDPVCGSAHCCLADFWRQRLGKSEFVAFQVSARGGVVKARVVKDRVLLSGKATTVAKGEVLVEGGPAGHSLVTPRLKLFGVAGSFAVCKLPTGSPLPPWATAGDLFAVTRTPDELSVVCRQEAVPEGVVCERDWRCLRVAGSMPFTLVGVLASLTTPVASAGVGVFAFSTFDTDYLLVKADEFRKAVAALRAGGHLVHAEGEGLYLEIRLGGGSQLQLVPVTPEQVELVAPLFDAYRQFYGQPPDLDGARRFLAERLGRGESVVYAVVEGGRALGFTQLYPSFSSVSMRPIWVLNDLFVAEDARRRGVGARLLRAARDHAMRTGAVRLTLSTAVTNTTAQALYERSGWRRDTAFLHYELVLPREP